nr:hypothetical protein CFP56_22334 [Quercus suber]
MVPYQEDGEPIDRRRPKAGGESKATPFGMVMSWTSDDLGLRRSQSRMGRVVRRRKGSAGDEGGADGRTCRRARVRVRLFPARPAASAVWGSVPSMLRVGRTAGRALFMSSTKSRRWWRCECRCGRGTMLDNRIDSPAGRLATSKPWPRTRARFATEGLGSLN